MAGGAGNGPAPATSGLLSAILPPAPLGGLQDKTCAREMRSGVRTLHLAGAIHYPHTPLISAAFHIIAQPPRPTPLLKHKSHGSEMSTSVHGSQSTKLYIYAIAIARASF